MKKQCLLITSRFPFPPIGGDKLKNFNMIKILSKYYDLHLVSLIDRTPDAEDQKFCETFCKSYRIFPKPKWRLLLNLPKSFFNGKPLQVNYYWFRDIQDYVDTKIERCDIVINTLIRTSEYVLKQNKIPKYLDMVDSIGLNYERSSKNVTSLLWKMIYLYETKKLMHYEKNCVHQYNASFFVNDKETYYWSKFGKTAWIPNGVHEAICNFTNTDAEYSNQIAFFGKMDYQPNVDAVLWFIAHVFPLLNQNIRFVIVGANPVNSIKNLISDRVSVTGFIEDPYLILNSCFCVTAPMLTGGGIQNKILETMALGKVVITTSLGADPIVGAIPNKHILIENSAKSMAAKINHLFTNPTEYTHIGSNAKDLISGYYTWESYEKKLMELIDP